MRIIVTSIVDLKRSAHNRLHEFIRHLIQNHDLTVLSIRDWWKESQTDTNLYQVSHGDLFNHVDIKYFTDLQVSPISQEIVSVFTIPYIMAKIDRSFDVHINYNTLISGYISTTLLKFSHIPTIYDIADDLPAMVGSSPQIPPVLRPIGEAVAKTMVKANSSSSKHVTLTTPALATMMQSHVKHTVIPNGVDTKLFHRQTHSNIKDKLGFSNSIVIGYIGVLREWVDLEPVYGILKNLNSLKFNTKLLVVGEEGGLGKQKKLASSHGVLEHVHFAGTIPYNTVPEYLSCMDIGIVPFGKNEIAASALPLKIFEYMACEVAIVCTRINAIEAVLKDVALYYDNQAELLSVVQNLIREPRLRGKMIEKGKDLVRKDYSWIAIASKFEELLISTANR